jgi:hypothetical protein
VKLHESVEIDAPAHTVWQVITDLDRYGEWNPFVVAAQSTLEPGEPIRMQVRLFASFTQPQTETVRTLEPERRLCYGLGPMPLGALSSRRCHEIEALSDSRCRYTSHFELLGWISALVQMLMGGRLERGFAGNTAGLKARAEQLAKAESA